MSAALTSDVGRNDVRMDGVYFVRGNNVILDPGKSGLSRSDVVGYGDSYVMDPGGEILVHLARAAVE